MPSTGQNTGHSQPCLIFITIHVAGKETKARGQVDFSRLRASKQKSRGHAPLSSSTSAKSYV